MGGAVVVVVVFRGAVVVVVVLTTATRGCVVVVVGADVPDADGSLVVVVDAVAPDTDGLVLVDAVALCNSGFVGMLVGVVPAVLDCVPVALLVCVGGLGEPLDEDVEVGAIVDDGAADIPEGALLAIDVGGVVEPLVMEGFEVVTAGLGAPGSEPGSNSNSNPITIMAKTDVVPTPFCSRRFFISNLNSLGIGRHIARFGSDIS